MIGHEPTEDQRAQIALLMDPATHGARSARGLRLRRIDTHGAIVILAGDRAFKLKRAVKFPFLDYSTAARRRRNCQAELRINRRIAPGLYVAVRPILRARGGLRLARAGARGRVVDWVLEMRRFPDDALLDVRARAGLLDRETIVELADAVAEFHRRAPRRPTHGGHAAMKRVVDVLAAGLVQDGSALNARKLRSFIARARRQLARHAALLDRRRAQGFVRRGHGDLHLRNVCLWRGKPALFDAIEFDEEMATVDVLYDLAFLLMDLIHRGMAGAANAAFNRYIARAIAAQGIEALKGLALLPLFLSVRAAVRARVILAAPDAKKRRAEARAYLDLALAFLDPPPPLLVAIGGLSGTGKSSLAAELAPALGPEPGAVVLRSDVLRKALLGVDLFQRLPQSGYAREVTRRVFAGLARAAGIALAAGHAAIADAVYLNPHERMAIERMARAAGAPFAGLWLEAPLARLEARVAARRRDVSDATVDYIRLQARSDPGPIAWTRVDADRPLPVVAAASRAIIGRMLRK